MVKIIIAIFLFIISCLPGCGEKGLRVDSFPGVDINEIICFNLSGEIIWNHNLREGALPKIPSQCQCIGLGNFSSGDKAVIFFEYNSSKKILTGSGVFNISCEECRKNLPFSLEGEVVKKVRDFSKGLASSPFFKY